MTSTAAAQEQPDTIALDELVLTAVRFYAKVLSTHPFLDGNGRTAFTLLQYALVRSDLACVAGSRSADRLTLLTSLGYSDEAAKYQKLAQGRQQPVTAASAS